MRFLGHSIDEFQTVLEPLLLVLLAALNLAHSEDPLKALLSEGVVQSHEWLQSSEVALNILVVASCDLFQEDLSNLLAHLEIVHAHGCKAMAKLLAGSL